MLPLGIALKVGAVSAGISKRCVMRTEFSLMSSAAMIQKLFASLNFCHG
jgi:hypothetical protein